MELLRRIDRVLSGHCVRNEQDLRRIQQLLQRLHLVHELIVDVQPAGGVNYQHVASGDHGLATGLFYQPLYRGGVGFRDLAFV